MTNGQTNPPRVPSTRTSILRSLRSLEGYHLSATDGSIGKVRDFYFDDEFWTIRYLVVDTGHWLPGHKVLLSPSVLVKPDWRERAFVVSLTREQVRHSPDRDSYKPVSRQRETEFYVARGWPFYWTASGAWPGAMMPAVPFQLPPSDRPRAKGDPHLRSAREVLGYTLQADDGESGAVDDFIADEETWQVRYLVVATEAGGAGPKVLIAPLWLVGPISWAQRSVRVAMSRDRIHHSPEFDPSAPVNRDYEIRLYDYYGRPKYWDASPAPPPSKES